LGRVARRSQRLGAVALAVWLGSSGLARAEPGKVDVATEREREARARYDAGVSAYQAGRFQQAISSFLVADELAPRAALAFNIARAYEKLDDSAQALRYYRDYLRREVSPVNMEGVRARITELEALLASRGVQQLTIRSEPSGAFVSIDGQPRGPTPWTGELVPGKHEVSLIKEGFAVIKRDVVLDAARAADVNIELGNSQSASSQPAAAPTPKTEPSVAKAPATKPTKDAPNAPRFGPWPFITLGAGGAALVTAVGFELARSSAERDAQSAPTQIAYVDRYEAMESRQTVARVFAGLGGALVVTGGVLLVLDLTSRNGAPVTAIARCTNERCVGAFQGVF
jgi:tetratricopeptide (TPR) repeat protein